MNDSKIKEIQYYSIQEAIIILEKMIAAARDKEIRSRLVLRLSQFDQKLEDLRCD